MVPGFWALAIPIHNFRDTHLLCTMPPHGSSAWAHLGPLKADEGNPRGAVWGWVWSGKRLGCQIDEAFHEDFSRVMSDKLQQELAQDTERKKS